MTPLDKDKILQEMKQILSLGDLPSKQRKDLVNYYKLIKDDVDFIKEIKKHDSNYWLILLEEAYSFCAKEHYEDAELDRKTEKLMMALKEETLYEAYELMEPFKIKEYAKFYDELALAQKSSAPAVNFDVIFLKRIYKLKHSSIILIPILFAIVSLFAFEPLSVAFKTYIYPVTDSIFFIIFGAILEANIFILVIFLYNKRIDFINKTFFKSEKIYKRHINNFAQLYCQLTQEDVLVNKSPTVTQRRLHPIKLNTFLKELLPENIAVLLPYGEKQTLRIIISVGLDEDIIRISFDSNSALVSWLNANVSDSNLLVKSTYNPMTSKVNPAQAEQIIKELSSIKSEVLVPMYEHWSKNKRRLAGALSFGPKLYGRYSKDDLNDLFWLGKLFCTAKKDNEIIEKVKEDFIIAIKDSYESSHEPKLLKDLRKKFLIFEAERIAKYDMAINRKRSS